MAKTTYGKQRSKLTSRRKKAVNMRPYAGKVKAFQNINGLAYQKKIREK